MNQLSSLNIQILRKYIGSLLVVKMLIFERYVQDLLCKISIVFIFSPAKKGCPKQRRLALYSIIPGIKGLLWHSKTSKITLISGKVNVLFFHNKKTDKLYKAIYDLRNGQKVESNSIVVKDITAQGKTIQGLKEELARVEW